jgi:signal transduction histidine kinase
MASGVQPVYRRAVSLARTLRAHGNPLLAGAVSVALQTAVWSGGSFAGDRVANAAAAFIFGGTLLLRRRAPLVPLVAGVIFIVVPRFHDLANSGVLAIGVMASLYSCGVSPRRATNVAGLAIGVASVLLTAWTSGPFSANDTLWVALIVSAPWLTGRFVRRARERARLLENRNIRLETEYESATARAAADERIRIARELHDVIAHALSLIVVQARGGRRMVKRERPADALDAFDTVEQAAQQALDEMRRLLGMLRQNDGELVLTPPPSLARLPDLITQAAGAGLCADLVVQGEPRLLPPGIEVSAYRIVQEGLTNALRHSGASRAKVVVTYAADRIELQVLDEGAGRAGTTTAGPGHGLIGMRERVAIYGGDLQAGSRPEGGYALRARLPLLEAE